MVLVVLWLLRPFLIPGLTVLQVFPLLAGFSRCSKSCCLSVVTNFLACILCNSFCTYTFKNWAFLSQGPAFSVSVGLFCYYHFFHAIAANDVHCLCRSHAVFTARANIFACTTRFFCGFFGSRFLSVAGTAPGSCACHAVPRVALCHLDGCPSLPLDEVQKL